MIFDRGEDNMEETSASILPPFLSDVFVFLGVVLSIILLIALSYIWSTQRQDREILDKLSADMKNLAKRVSGLENASASIEKTEDKKIEKVPEKKPVEIPVEKEKPPTAPAVNKTSRPWDDFLENYNLIAASMAVPGQLRACENFVSENNLKVLAYVGNMKFAPVSGVSDSRFWGWQIESSDKYAVVPNPMIHYDEDLHGRAGMKETFASNYENGKYTKYFVELPAILIYNGKNEWKVWEPGVIKLER